MHPTDFNRELQKINPDYFLEFNEVFKCWQARQKRKMIVNFAPIIINNEHIKLSTIREFSVVIKTLNKNEINSKTLDYIRSEEYINNRLGAYKRAKEAIKHNERLKEKQENNLRDDMRYGLKQDKRQIFQEKSVLINNNPLAS